jgi:hypothetical protein
MTAILTHKEAVTAFELLKANRDEIAFHILAEGCECRAQLMIEQLQARGIEPGRVWTLAVDRALAFPNPANPQQLFKWHNHTAPTIGVEGVEYGVLVLLRRPVLSPCWNGPRP